MILRFKFFIFCCTQCYGCYAAAQGALLIQKYTATNRNNKEKDINYILNNKKHIVLDYKSIKIEEYNLFVRNWLNIYKKIK